MNTIWNSFSEYVTLYSQFPNNETPRVAWGAHHMTIIVNEPHALFMPIIGLPYSLASQEYREYLSDPLYSDRKHTICLEYH